MKVVQICGRKPAQERMHTRRTTGGRVRLLGGRRHRDSGDLAGCQAHLGMPRLRPLPRAWQVRDRRYRQRGGGRHRRGRRGGAWLTGALRGSVRPDRLVHAPCVLLRRGTSARQGGRGRLWRAAAVAGRPRRSTSSTKEPLPIAETPIATSQYLERDPREHARGRLVEDLEGPAD